LTITSNVIPNAIPALSVIIAVYNDWLPLEQCLHSLSDQAAGPSFEVIVVDDGSEGAVPEFILKWSRSFPLTVVGQIHAGIPAARNRGIKVSQGSLLLFVDSDCRLQAGCLASLDAALTNNPMSSCFQLRLIGEISTLVGRAEDLRLKILQDHLLQANGCIRYLNTSGFAIRRTRVNCEEGLFDATVLRGEDTLLLANLIQGGDLPLFVSTAVVQHAIPLTLMECLRKDARSGRLEARAYNIIVARGVKIRVNYRERLAMLVSMWRASGERSIGRPALLVLLVRQLVERAFSVAHSCRRGRPIRTTQSGNSSTKGYARRSHDAKK